MRRIEREGRGRVLVPNPRPPPMPFSRWPLPQVPSSERNRHAVRAPLSSHHLPVPGPRRGPGACCRRRHHLRGAGVPGPLPNLGAANTWPIVAPASPAGSCARAAICALGPPGKAAGCAGRGRGPRPRRAPFKRCQGLIDEKWPRAGANLSREAAGRRAGAREGEAA